MSSSLVTTERLQTLLDLAGSLTSTLELEEVLEELAGRVKSLSASTSLAISVLDRDRDGVVTLVGVVEGVREELSGEEEELYPLADFPATRHVIEKREPVKVRVSNRDDDPHERRLLEDFGHRALLMLPLTVRGEVVGIMEVFDSEERDFEADVVAFWEGVSGIVAVALRNASLYEDVHRLALQALNAEEHERRRLSEMLHDGALQNLYAARHEVAAARAGDAEGLERVETAVAESLTLLRDGITELHPLIRDEAGLAAALEALAKRSERHGGFTCTVEVESEAAGVHDELVLSVARELLTNAVKHSRADRVSVSVECEADHVRLIVADDGVGLSPERRVAAVRDGHIGLASVAARVKAVGGEFGVKSAPGQGTVARASIPAGVGTGWPLIEPRRRVPVAAE